MFLDFFPDTGLGDGLKNSRIRVKKLFEFFPKLFSWLFNTFKSRIVTDDCISMEKKSGSEHFESISLQNQAFTDYCNHNLTWIRILIFISRTLTSRLCRGWADWAGFNPSGHSVSCLNRNSRSPKIILKQNCSTQK